MLGLRLDAEMESQVRQLARQSGRSTSDLVRDALRVYLKQHSVDDDLTRELRLIAARVDDDGMDDAEMLTADLNDLRPEHPQAA